MSEPQVECGLHGLSAPAYVCQHLNLEQKVGFIQAYDPKDESKEVLQAWCRTCDAILTEEGSWNDRSEAFAQIKMVCAECFHRMRALNTE